MLGMFINWLSQWKINAFLCIQNGCFYCVSLQKCFRSNLNFWLVERVVENLCQLYFPTFFLAFKDQKNISIYFNLQVKTKPQLFSIWEQYEYPLISVHLPLGYWFWSTTIVRWVVENLTFCKTWWTNLIHQMDPSFS